MLIDQITPHLPKENEEANVHVKHLQAMLDTGTIADLVHDQEDKDGVTKMTTDIVPVGTQPVASPPEQRGEGHHRDNHDLHDIICDRDACSRIENQC
jgi:hypothetical protein